ncbi:tape measure protein [Microbacterium phage Triscuit]|nr:tape measure protein [Microbacterium phage Triscuit]
MADMTWRAQMLLDVRDALDSYTKLRQEHLSTVSALGSGAGALTAVGAAFTAAGVGLGAGLLDAALAAGEFERKLDYFTAVAGPGAADQYDLIREEALRLGNDTIYSAGEIADSFVELAKSGVGVEDLLAGIGEAVSSLGAAADMPLEDAARGLTTVLNTFGLAADDAVSVVDKLAGAANSSAIDVNDLILTLSYAGASAKVAGIEFDDVNTAIALLGERGIRGSKAGTGLRQMFDKLLAPTKKGTSALKDLGIVTEDGTNALLDMDGGLKPIPQLLDILNGSLAGLTTSEKMDVLGNIFPITSLPTILNLLDGGSEAMARLNAEIGKTTALDIATQRLDNLSGDIEILKGNLETLKINVGSVADGFMRWVTQGLVAVTQWLNNLDPAILNLIVGIVAAVAGILTFIGVAGLFAGALLNIAQLVLVLGPALQTLAKVFPILTVAVARLKAVLLFPATPIIAVFLAIAGALAFFFTQTEKGQQVWGQLTTLFQQAMVQIQPLLGVLMQLAGTLGGVLMSALSAVVPMLVAFGNFIMGVLAPYIPIITAAFSTLAGAFTGVGTSASGLGPVMDIVTNVITGLLSIVPVLIQMLMGLALTAMTALINALPTIIAGATQMFLGILTALVSAIPTIITGVLQLITGLVTALTGALPQIIMGAVQLFTGLLQGLILILPILINGVLTIISQLIPVLISMIPMLLQAAIQLFTALVLALPEIILQLVTTLTEMLPTLIETIVGMIPMLIEAAIQLFMALIDGLLTAIPLLLTAIIGAIPQILSAIIGAIPIILEGAIQLFTSLVKAIPVILPKLISAIIGMVPQLIGAIIGMVPQLISAGVQLFTSLKDSVSQAVPQVVSSLVRMGKDLIDGLARGIKNAGNAVMNAIGNVVNGAVDWAKGLLGIKSPSRVFKAIGNQTIQGMIIGIDGMRNGLRRSFDIVSDSLDTFYDQVYAAREFDVMMNLQSQMAPMQVGLGAQFDELNERLAEIAEKDTVNIEKLEVKKEEGENLDVSLPNAIRKTSYVVG